MLIKEELPERRAMVDASPGARTMGYKTGYHSCPWKRPGWEKEPGTFWTKVQVMTTDMVPFIVTLPCYIYHMPW
jgi:hypothetical protein